MYIHIFASYLKTKTKNMKQLLTTATALFVTFAVMAGGNGETYKVSKKTSSIDWVGKKVTGEHTGTINIMDGEVMVTDGMISGGTLWIDMNTIVVTDIEDAETNAKLKGHLQSPDFFSVEKFPKSKLEISKVESKGGDQYVIHGNLTIKDKTEKISIPSTIKMEEGKLVAIGETEIDRTKYDIKYGSGQFFEDLGDKMIYDNFSIKFKVGAMK